MTSSKTLQQAIADITIWRKGEQRAPHKPLLLLHVLAAYQQGHGRLFDYGSEVRDLLHSLLERFDHSARNTARICPSGAYIRRWVLGATKRRALVQHPAQQQNSPVGELVTHNVAGGFDEQHFTLLKKNKTS